MSQTQQASVVNGVDVNGLMETIRAIQGNPALGQFQFRTRNQWMGAGYNRSTIKDFYGAGKEDDTRKQPFILDNDEPMILLGNDQAANPVEYLLHALAGCLTSTIAYHSASRGIEIESMESELRGDLDVQGFMGLSSQVPRGYQKIRVTFRVKSDCPTEKLEELARFSPVFNSLTNPTPVEVQIIKSS